MNSYLEIARNSKGKKIVRIKCNLCEGLFEVQKQTSHDSNQNNFNSLEILCA